MRIRACFSFLLSKQTSICLSLVFYLTFAFSAQARDVSYKLDFDGDGKADIAVYRPGDPASFDRPPSYWYVLLSSSGQIRTRQWGISLDIPTAGDFDGDGITDESVFRWSEENTNPPNEFFNVNFNNRSSEGFEAIFFGNLAQKFVRDYYGTGRGQLSELTGQGYLDPETYDVYHLYYYNIQLNNGQGVNSIYVDSFVNVGPAYYGAPGDYDNNGATDAAVFQKGGTTSRCFRVWFSPDFTNTTVQCLDVDSPTPGDYDGDGKTDYAGYKIINGLMIWRIKYSLSGQVGDVSWGVDGDKVVPADYDGDGKTDIAVFRPSNTTWYILRTSDNGITTQVFGLPNDIPIAESLLTRLY